MFNNIKKISLICTLCLIAIFSISNIGYCASKTKKVQIEKNDEIDFDSFSVTILDKKEVSATLLTEGKNNGIHFCSKDANYKLDIYFNQNIELVKSKLSTNKIILPRQSIKAAELIDLNGKFDITDKFAISRLYEDDSERNYVLVSEDNKYKVQIGTDCSGNFSSLLIIKFRDEEGIYSYLNFMKLYAKEYS